MSLFPIFVKLERRPCLVVGAGNVALEKITSLLRAGANLRVVAPVACDAVQQLAENGTIALELRGFNEADLEGQAFVITATDSRDVNRQVFLAAQQRGLLCNSVDDPPNCDFYFASIVRARQAANRHFDWLEKVLRWRSDCGERLTHSYQRIPQSGSIKLAVCGAKFWQRIRQETSAKRCCIRLQNVRCAVRMHARRDSLHFQTSTKEAICADHSTEGNGVSGGRRPGRSRAADAEGSGFAGDGGCRAA